MGVGATAPVAGDPCRPPGRVVVLRAQGPDPRSAVFGRRDPCPAPRGGSCRRRSPSGCAASTPTCSRGRDVPRRGSDRRDPAAARPLCGRCLTGSPAYPTCRSRDHVGVPARDRQHRDRPRRSREASADDLGHKRASARSLSRPATEAAPSARPRPPAKHQRAPTARPAEYRVPLTGVARDSCAAGQSARPAPRRADDPVVVERSRRWRGRHDRGAAGGVAGGPAGCRRMRSSAECAVSAHSEHSGGDRPLGAHGGLLERVLGRDCHWFV